MVHSPRKKSCQRGREKFCALRIEMKFIGLVIPGRESGWINGYQRIYASLLRSDRHLMDGILRRGTIATSHVAILF